MIHIRNLPITYLLLKNSGKINYSFSLSWNLKKQSDLWSMQRQTLHFLQLYLVFRKQPSYLHLCATFVSMFKGKWPTLSYLASTVTLFAPTPLPLGFDIHLCWLPGHVGILGNERADRAAKAAHRTDMQPCLIPPSDFKPIIRRHITAMWQATWDESPLNKLHEIAPIVNEPCTHHLSVF